MTLQPGDKLRSPDESMVIEVVAVRDTGVDFVIVEPRELIASEDIGDPFFGQGWVAV